MRGLQSGVMRSWFKTSNAPVKPFMEAFIYHYMPLLWPWLKYPFTLERWWHAPSVLLSIRGGGPGTSFPCEWKLVWYLFTCCEARSFEFILGLDPALVGLWTIHMNTNYHGKHYLTTSMTMLRTLKFRGSSDIFFLSRMQMRMTKMARCKSCETVRLLSRPMLFLALSWSVGVNLLSSKGINDVWEGRYLKLYSK